MSETPFADLAEFRAAIIDEAEPLDPSSVRVLWQRCKEVVYKSEPEEFWKLPHALDRFEVMVDFLGDALIFLPNVQGESVFGTTKTRLLASLNRIDKNLLDYYGDLWVCDPASGSSVHLELERHPDRFCVRHYQL